MLPLIAGCAGGGSIPSPTPLTAPAIVKQPQDLSVPMGASGTFSVAVSGSNTLQYQWSRSGLPISGATGDMYITPVVAFADSGTPYTVVVHNSVGSVTSVPAILTVTARAPKTGDLRFQQVDAPSTINGYSIAPAPFGTQVGCPPPGGGGSTSLFTSGIGSAFYLNNNLCGFEFIPFSLPAGVTGLEMSYGGYPLSQYAGVLSGTYLSGPFSPGDPESVVTSLILEPAGAAVGIAFIHSESVSGFDYAQYTVAASALQSAAANEGLHGRVVTAVSYDGSQATFLSYGWSGDPASIYEAKVVFATFDTAPGLITDLSSEGYIVTASGTTQAQDGSGMVLVGTRLQGDQMARPLFITADYNALFAQGYATVAVLEKFLPAAPFLSRFFIGQR